MNNLPGCILYTDDDDWAHRIEVFLQEQINVTRVTSLAELRFHMDALRPCLLLIDLRTEFEQDDIEMFHKEWEDSLMIGFAHPHTEPARMAEEAGLYQVMEPDIPGDKLSRITVHALEHLELIKENQFLKSSGQVPAVASSRILQPMDLPPSSESPVDLRHFSRAAREFTDLDQMLNRIVEGVESSMKVSRVGIFAWVEDRHSFAIRAGQRCLESCRNLRFNENHPLVHFFAMNMHIVTRTNLGHIEDLKDREMLSQHLKLMGAEILIPLFAQGNIIGWMFLGQRMTGQPFTAADLEDMAIVAEHVSTNIENALLYEEATIQRSLATTLLHSIPSGIVAIDNDGYIRWFNESAERILERNAKEVLDQEIEILSSQFADLMRTSLAGKEEVVDRVFDDFAAQKLLEVQCRRLVSMDKCLGAVALIHDKTQDRIIEAKEKRLERSTFWTELAAAMSHEIRNPLVTIKTFAQLLPERYDDDDFRHEFSTKVNAEADRLNAIVEQINNFANPPDLNFTNLDAATLIEHSIGVAFPKNREEIKLEINVPADLPKIHGDQNTLIECLAQLLKNALEATGRRKKPHIVITASVEPAPDDQEWVCIAIQDAGHGIPEEIRSKLFSPFCTTKARGMGLGLPISQRTIMDHEGIIDINTGAKGTTIVVKLPSQKVEAKK